MATERIILGGGCFWCIEAAYSSLKGVASAVSGYAGGTTEDPSYQQICTGNTGHAEVVEVTFDNQVIGLRTLLEIFFTLHDPTTLNRQGADVGTQYRSVIFYTAEDQLEAITGLVTDLGDAHIWEAAIVTEVLPAPTFYPAEKYHQEYFKQNPAQQYCRIVISPKMAKFRKEYAALVDS